MFFSEEIQKKYEERMQNYIDAVCMKEPKKLTVGVNYHTAQIAWVKTFTKKTVYDPNFYIESCVEFYRDFQVDRFSIPLIQPLEVCWMLGRNTFFVGKDKVTVQHHENTPMREDEYDQLIADPMGFYIKTLLPRKFPRLNEGHDTSYELLRAASEAFIRFRAANTKYINRAKEKYGIISFNGGKAYVPLDVIMDRLRGISGLVSDIHRQPQNVIDACTAIESIYLKPIANLNKPVPQGFCTLHAPMFLNRKQYEKFFWPGLKKIIDTTYEKGSTTWVQMQGDCHHILDYFLEVPKGSVVLNFESEDPIEVKKRLGHHIVIEAGLPLASYVHKSKQECLDEAKRIIEACAPGGGFIYAMGSGALSSSDINQENMNAVFQLVHDY
jgi:hypothetical protein